ncbi:type I-G CRISPR-associated protein Cas8g2 [Yunchengibacter salinarum]|uniref:type I-G CRISPR-associated protein Cas8g2 n=1 Tax=Yunchengibacter salinarum TaxID=3133399 RepID=UPI0035B5EF6F
MADHSIPVDLFNPGQVFACLGFLEAADVLLGGAKGGFNWHDEAEPRFHIHAAGGENPVATVLNFLARAEVKSIAPQGSKNDTRKWKIPTIHAAPEDPFPFPDPSSPATLPAILRDGDQAITLDHWGDATTRDNVKFWAGSGGYPGAAFTQDSLALFRDAADTLTEDPFSFSVIQSSSFRFDWRRDYIPIDAGFSPNDHQTISMTGYPVVELLAAIGLTHARPQRHTKLEYRYGVAGTQHGTLLPALFHRAALGCAALPFPHRSFRMQLGWPGQEGQARCILDVTEEPKP